MSQNINPRVIGRLNKELKQLMSSPPEGVRFIPGDMDLLTEVHIEMDGPEQTPYEGGTFRMKLVLGQDYPAAPPRGFFLTKIYHPNVSSNGDICVNTLKKDWNESVTLCHILAVIRCLLIVPFPESSLNDEAGKLFMDSYEDYAERAKLMTTVHAKRKSAAAAEVDERAAEERSGALAGAKGPNGEAKENEKGANAGSGKFVTKAADKASKEAQKQKENKKKALKRL